MSLRHIVFARATRTSNLPSVQIPFLSWPDQRTHAAMIDDPVEKRAHEDDVPHPIKRLKKETGMEDQIDVSFLVVLCP